MGSIGMILFPGSLIGSNPIDEAHLLDANTFTDNPWVCNTPGCHCRSFTLDPFTPELACGLSLLVRA